MFDFPYSLSVIGNSFLGMADVALHTLSDGKEKMFPLQPSPVWESSKTILVPFKFFELLLNNSISLM